MSIPLPIPAAIPAASPDLAQDKLAQVRACIPEAFNLDGSLNPDKLKEALGEACAVERERFGLNWAGKQEAMRLAGKPTTATLRPVPGESVDFDTTQNAIIEGDNLEVLKVLQRSYHGKIKMIYIDPPYNTGQDFVYPDDYAEPLASYKQMTGQVDEDGRWKVSNGETSGKKHSNWLNLMVPRLVLARNLLRDDGMIFVSIDDNEVAHLRMVLDEVFGGENFVGNAIWQKRYSVSSDAKGIPAMHDHVVIYQKTEAFLPNLLARTEEQDAVYKNPDSDPRGRWRSDNLTRSEHRERDRYAIVSPTTGEKFYPPDGASWRHPEKEMEKMIEDGRVWFGADGTSRPAAKRFLSEVKQGRVASAWWPFSEVGHTDESKKEVQEIFEGKSPFDTPKPTRLIRRMLEIATSPSSLILDFFAGSGTTAHAVMAQNALDGGNRKFILVQLPEPTPQDSPARKAGFPTIAHITRERVRRAGKKLAGSGTGAPPVGMGLFSSTPSNPSTAHGQGAHATPDFGFRAFTLDTSNFSAWNPAASTMAQLELQVKQHADSTLPGRTEQDLLYEILIKAGFAPTAAVEKFTVNGQSCFGVADRQWVLCLDAHAKLETLEAIAALSPVPTRVVCLDGALADDAAKANAAAFYRQKGIELRVV